MTSLSNHALHRARQFIGALRPWLADEERLEVRDLLGDALYGLYGSMALRDQRHCFDVYRMLLAEHREDRDLLAAALLHDAGKSRMAGVDVRLWHRVAYVAMETLAPVQLRRLARRPGILAALHHHSERGAILAEALGATPGAVELIRRHEESGHTDERARLLRLADDSC